MLEQFSGAAATTNISQRIAPRCSSSPAAPQMTHRAARSDHRDERDKAAENNLHDADVHDGSISRLNEKAARAG